MYYVYELVDPRNDSVFYVGKGSGDRAYQHERNVRSGSLRYKRINPKLFNKIAKIIGMGFAIVVRVVEQFQNEMDALAYEKQRIAQFGLDQLCNLTPGGVGGDTFTHGTNKADKCKHMRESWTVDRTEAHRATARKNWTGERNPMRRDDVRQHILGDNNPMKRPEVVAKRSGQFHHKTKLTWPIIREMREKFEQGMYTKTELAKLYGVTKQQVSNIVNHRQWRETCVSS
jgi:hypothetical protein